MSDRKPKSPYLGRNLEELRGHYDVNFSEFPRPGLCKSAPKIFEKAEKCRLEGDEEMSFVLYMKFISLIQYMKKNEHDEHFTQYFKQFNWSEVIRSLDYAEKLTVSLRQRYTRNQFLIVRQPDLNEPALPCKEPVFIFGEKILLCETAGSQVLMVDIREEEDYELAHIDISKFWLINVPGSTIRRGMSPSEIAETLCPQWKGFWNKRGLMDLILIVDEDSTQEKYQSDGKAMILREILLSDKKYHCPVEPVLLSGGFSSWAERHPTRCVKAANPGEEIVITSLCADPAVGIFFINPCHLYESLKKDKVLILDIRPKNEYDLSRINYKNSVVNIPEEAIYLGMTATGITRVLPATSKVPWERRGLVDLLVIMDWSTSSKSFSGSSKVSILKDILMQWDPETQYTREPAILDGGYEEWLFYYPVFTTNPKVKQPLKTREDLAHLLDSIEYPSLIDNTLKLKPTVDRTVKPPATIPAEPRVTSGIVGTESSPSLFDRVKEPSRSHSLGTLVPTQPAVDRAVKAAALQFYKEKEEKMKKLLKVADDCLNLEKSRLTAEVTWGNLRTEREHVSEEETKQDLQKREEELLQLIQRLETEQKEKEHENKALRMQLDSYKKKEESLKLDSTQKKLEEMIAEIQAKEEEKRLISTELEELFKERQNYHTPKQNRHEPHESTPAKQSRKSNSGRSNSTKFRDVSPSYSPVTRSHSYMNISNPENEDKAVFHPKFDRKVKPLTPPDPADIRAARTRDFSPCLGTRGLGLTGLKNLGNTCYMNSIIQCLCHTMHFSQYLCNRSYVELITSKNGRAEILEELAAVIEAMWNHQFRYISIKDLKRVVGQKKEQFNTKEQQDSSEFLTLLMDWLHEDLKLPTKTKKLKEATGEAEKAWEIFHSKNSSIVVDLFYGQQKSSVTCLTCQRASITYETFANLTLPLPRRANKCNLEDCIKLYLDGENITGWNCPWCKEPRNAMKKFDLIKLPPVLIIHLKRFSVEGWYRKKQTLVDFPVTHFSMMKYVPGSKKNIFFDLYGVSNHHGNMDGGHYTASCKSYVNRQWYKFDDQDISELQPQEARTNEAYILFYQSVEDCIER